jgi:para-nitrobenzyl esterase
LIRAQGDFIAKWPEHFPLRSAIDGILLSKLPIATIANGSTRGKRLLIGTMRDESAFFIGPHPQRPVSAGDLGNLPLESFGKVFNHYHAVYPEANDELLRIRSLTAEEYWLPSMRAVQAHEKGGGKSWLYRLDFSESSGPLRGYAYHSMDVRLVWNKPSLTVENAAEEAAMSQQIHQAWLGFLHGKVPASPGLPTWPEFHSDTRPTMILDSKSRVELSPQEQELRLWDGVL